MFRLIIKEKKEQSELDMLFLSFFVDPGPNLLVCGNTFFCLIYILEFYLLCAIPDVGYNLKNEDFETYKSMNRINTQRRIILSKTPRPGLLGTIAQFGINFEKVLTKGLVFESTELEVQAIYFLFLFSSKNTFFADIFSFFPAIFFPFPLVSGLACHFLLGGKKTLPSFCQPFSLESLVFWAIALHNFRGKYCVCKDYYKKLDYSWFQYSCTRPVLSVVPWYSWLLRSRCQNLSTPSHISTHPLDLVIYRTNTDNFVSHHDLLTHMNEIDRWVWEIYYLN